MTIHLPPVVKAPCPLCGKPIGGQDAMAHLNWHRAGEPR